MSESKDTIIIGGGISGLVVAHRLRATRPDHRLVVLEKAERPGGVIQSFAEDGFHAEWGPHGFLDNCAESRALLAETGLDREAVAASLATYVRYVCINSSLMMIPQSPLKILRAPLIPFSQKLRVLGDLFKPPLEGEPTVAKWAAYRFGRALLPYVDAVFTGTYAGDYNELKIDAVMPGVRALERHHGSVIRGAIARARATRKKSGGKKLAMPSMTSFPGGMQRLPQRLAEPLERSGDLRLGQSALHIAKQGDEWLVETASEHFTAPTLVLALPINQSLPLLTSLAPDLADRSLPEARLVTVVFGFRGGSLPPGFGFPIPEVEQRFTLGTLFSSNMFPNRAPEGSIVFETLIGGRRHPERLDLDDQILIDRALADVRGLLDLPPAPSFTKVLRPLGGIPQLESSYLDLLQRRNSLVRQHLGLFVCGFGWEGIGLNDMIKTATAVATNVIERNPQVQDEAAVKKVYF